jgi:hypothetical protein
MMSLGGILEHLVSGSHVVVMLMLLPERVPLLGRGWHVGSDDTQSLTLGLVLPPTPLTRHGSRLLLSIPPLGSTGSVHLTRKGGTGPLAPKPLLLLQRLLLDWILAWLLLAWILAWLLLAWVLAWLLLSIPHGKPLSREGLYRT